MGRRACCLPVRGEEDTAMADPAPQKSRRIASLLPAATEIVCALGLEKALVGRSHECDFPPAVRRLPSLTRAREFEGGSGAIDGEIRRLLREGLSVFEVDVEA